MIEDNVISVRNIDMTNNAVVAVVAVVDSKAMILIVRMLLQSAEQFPLNISDERDEPDDEDDSLRLLYATTLMLPT